MRAGMCDFAVHKLFTRHDVEIIGFCFLVILLVFVYLFVCV